MTKRSTAALTVGLDLGDRFSEVCVVDTASGEIERELRIRKTPAGLARQFEGRPVGRQGGRLDFRWPSQG